MPHCAARAALALALITWVASAQETASSPRSALREFMRDAAKAKIKNDKPSEIPPPQTLAATSEPVLMRPFVVEEKRTPRIAGLDEEMQKQKALESHAFYHADITKKSARGDRFATRARRQRRRIFPAAPSTVVVSDTRS
jgi:hypothetical protein